jgi:hypothetical protein
VPFFIAPLVQVTIGLQAIALLVPIRDEVVSSQLSVLRNNPRRLTTEN